MAVENREVVGYLGLDVDYSRHHAQILDLAVAPDIAVRASRQRCWIGHWSGVCAAVCNRLC